MDLNSLDDLMDEDTKAFFDQLEKNRAVREQVRFCVSAFVCLCMSLCVCFLFHIAVTLPHALNYFLTHSP